MAAPSPVFYLILGFGADERVFLGLQLAGEVQVLRWLPPRSPGEPLPDYAARLAASNAPVAGSAPPVTH